MAAKQQFSHRGYGKIFVFICAIIVALSGTFLFAAKQGDASEPARYRVFSLRHISAEQGKKYLAEAGIGIVSQLPSPNTLLVTAQPKELIKASALLKLVDAEELFHIKAIFPSSEAKNLPSNKQIAAEVGKISIGTFSEPPAPAEKTRAIIDIHNDAVTVVAPAEQIERIISAIKQLQGTETQAPQPTVPSKPVEPNQPDEPKPEEIIEAELEELHLAKAPKRDKSHLGTPKDDKVEPEKIAASDEPQQVETDAGDYELDELFSKLLDSLDKAEEMADEQAQQVSRPNEPAPHLATKGEVETQPTAVATVPEQKAPSKPTTAAKEPNLPAIEGPQAKEAAEKPKLQLQPEPASESAIGGAIETEQPGEVTEPVSKVRSYEPEPITNGDEMLELNLPEKLNIVDLMDLVGKYLHLNYMYDEVDVKGKEVSLKVQGPIKVKDLYPLLESVLKFKGFVMTRKVNLVTIVPAAKVLEIDPDLHTDADKIEYGDVIITRVFTLKHIDTANAKNLLDQMKLGVNITSIPKSGTLIVTGYAYRMARIEELLDMIDKPGEAKQFRFRQLRYTMAQTLAPKIKTLAEQLGTISITIASPAARITRKPRESAAAFRTRQQKAAAAAKAAAPTAKPTVYLDADERTNRILIVGLADQLVVVDKLIDALDVEYQDLRTLRLYEIQHVGAEEIKEKLEELGIISGGRPTTRAPTRAKAAKPGTPTTPTAAKEPLVEEPQVVVIEATNSVLVNATAEQHAQIATIIAYVDSEPEEAAINYKVYPLENQDPEELAGVLNQLIQETTTKEEKGAKIVTTKKKIEEDITIIPDPKTYSLIVYASKKNHQWISSLIKQLDEYRPQVLLDVTLVEISKNDEFSFDLNLIQSFPFILEENYSGFANILVAPDDKGEGGKYSSDIMEKLRESRRDRFIDLQSMSGASTAFYGDRHINVLLEAMQTKGYGRVLARPKLLVNDNEQGTIKSQETTYITRTKVSYRQGPVGEEDIPVVDTTFEPYEAGIQLDIEPHISKGDQLRLTITMTRTDFRDTAASLNQGTPPDKVTSDVTTIVTVPDSTTIILGGLEKLSQSKGGTKVPLLGDIPIIGGLFRSTANTDAQSRLYVFVKAHILRPGEELTGESDIEVVSAKNRATFERYEEEMQKYEDWPGIKPEPMDPLRILEAD
jgi:type II secretory pathway component GspD/PulD (secretin)